jgi:hypothetical protein
MPKQNYGECKFCGAENVFNPKTGKVFCSEKCWLKTSSTSSRPVQTYQTAQTTPNWEEIGRGKVRHGFAVEAYKLGRKLDFNLTNEINDWTEFVMTGTLPGVKKATEEVIPF